MENLYEIWEDEKEFKKYYNDFYLKTNQEEKHNNLHKKLLIYNQNAKNDFLHMSLLGLDKIYLQALVDKNKIYFTNLSWEFALRIFDNKFLSQKQIEQYIEFLKHYNDMLEWINTLDKNLYFEARVEFNSMVSTFVCNFLITNKEPCKLDTKNY
ncbi:hypothetical protein AAID97_06595 [Campylobacter coli]|nr:hypothetical protein [Campylobacter jejuni]